MAASEPVSSTRPREQSGAPASTLADLLRRWRNSRRISQEELALAADTTCRYVSFIENGRAAPSRAMIERLAGALEMNTLQYNTLCEAAGYLPVLPTMPVADAGERQALLQPILDGHMPNPGFVVRPDLTILAANAAAEQLLRLGPYPGPETPLRGLNVMELVVRHDALRPFIGNWSEYTWRGLQYLHKVWRRLETQPAILETLRADPEAAALEARIETPQYPAEPGALVIDHNGQSWPYLQVHSRVSTADHEIGACARAELLFPKWSTATTPGLGLSGGI